MSRRSTASWELPINQILHAEVQEFRLTRDCRILFAQPGNHLHIHNRLSGSYADSLRLLISTGHRRRCFRGDGPVRVPAFGLRRTRDLRHYRGSEGAPLCSTSPDGKVYRIQNAQPRNLCTVADVIVCAGVRQGRIAFRRNRRSGKASRDPRAGVGELYD